MVYENLHIEFLFGDRIGADNVQRFLEQCIEVGCTTQQNGGTESFLYFGPQTDYEFVETDRITAINYLIESSSGTVSLWYRNLDFSLGLGTQLAPNAAGMYISIDPVFFKGVKKEDEEHPKYMMELIDLIIGLYRNLDILHVCGRSEPPAEEDHPKLEATTNDLRAGNIDTLFWLNVFNPSAVKHLGREQLLSDYWQTQELDDGSILLILSDNPVQFSYQEKKDQFENILE